MSSGRSKFASTQALVAYLEEELTASDARAVEAQLAESLETRRRFDQLLTIRDVLASPADPLESIDLTGAVQQALANAAPPPRRRHVLAAGLTALIAAAACVGLLALPRLREDAEYRAKSAGITAPVSAPRFHAYTPTDSGIMPVAGSLSRDAGLVFSYSNPSTDAYPFLMVFGVDASREVRWFYPPYEAPGSDPTSITVHAHDDASMLPDIIHHDLAVGRMVVYALFTREPLHVSQIERWLRGYKGEPARPPRRDAVLLRLPVMVKR